MWIMALRTIGIGNIFVRFIFKYLIRIVAIEAKVTVNALNELRVDAGVGFMTTGAVTSCNRAV